MQKWFLLHDEQVSGPFTGDEVNQQLINGFVNEAAMVWGRPQQEWINIKQWRQLDRDQNPQTDGVRQWHYSNGLKTFGPYPAKQLILELEAVQDKQTLLLWTKGMKAWAPIYEFPQIMDQIGMERRSKPRAAINGKLVVTLEDERSVMGELVDVGPGGCGAQRLSGLQPGQKVHIDIRSEALSTTVRANAEVRFVGDDGFIGFKFDSIGDEAKAAITGFIRQGSNKSQSAA